MGAPISDGYEGGYSAGGVRLLAVSNDAEEGCNAGVGSTVFCQMPMVR